MFSIHFDIGNIVFKDGWDIDLWFEIQVSHVVQMCPFCYRVHGKTSTGLKGRMIGVGGELRTSGNVPLEKTLFKKISKQKGKKGFEGEMGSMDLHQQTGLSAGTITDDDKLATDLSHGGCSGES